MTKYKTKKQTKSKENDKFNNSDMCNRKSNDDFISKQRKLFFIIVLDIFYSQQSIKKTFCKLSQKNI